jgi:hypothetical protein
MMPMINDTERKAFEEVLRALKAAKEKLQITCGGVREYEGGIPTQSLFPMIDAAILHGQAALAQRENSATPLYDIPDNELPGMWEKADFEGGKPDVVRGPAPSLCTAEEAAELAEQLSIQRFRNFGEDGMTFTASPEQLAAIINADRAKR